jgi:Uma2 family endonuclease
LVVATGLYTYPDVSVVCGEPRLVQDRHQDNLLNPQLLIEVLSPSTEAFDRGRKFEQYRTIPSFLEYLLVPQEKPALEHYLREQGGAWRFSAVPGIDSALTLPTLGIELPLAEVYRRVVFEP